MGKGEKLTNMDTSIIESKTYKVRNVLKIIKR